MKSNDSKNVTLNFEYNSQLVTINTNPFKQLIEIKKLAIKKINLMNNINLDHDQLNCYYLGRNLNDYEQQKICELFSNREIISIKLKSPKKHLTINHNNLKNSNSKNNNISITPNASPIRGKNYFSNICKNTNVFSSGFNAIRDIKKDQNSVIQQLFSERLKNKSSLLPMINFNNSRNNSNSPNIENKTEIDDNYFIPLSKKEKNINNNINGIGIICGKCNEYYINEYCRTCNEFMCSECKENYDHNNHLSIQLVIVEKIIIFLLID